MHTKYLAVAFLALLFLSATSALASVGEVHLYVEGLACPFCTFGIEKSLKKVPGVVSLETTIRTGLVRIQLEPKALLDPAALNEAVRKAGFTPSRIEATVTGTLVTSDEHPALKSSETNQTFRLVESGSADLTAGRTHRERFLSPQRKRCSRRLLERMLVEGPECR